MKIIFDIPDNSKCLSMTVVFGDGATLEMTNVIISTKGLYDGQTIQVPSNEEDGKQKHDPAVDGSLEEWAAGEESKFD